ncbi:MIT [Glarea lozoyensis ATCC 20868]|uniref:MIT n=1 Tax=Glarea lozoyensis (strain ATCC 20868 / MF5171) TaxID=1116229 RepID=S3CE08_GLAL2|nr:MIT [Glarea lozoyensis ATCC 20868]EPE24245.1 MIT [Glarea lozoyensis ATCC 20868]
MESSPLTLAHDHARAASVATSSSDTTVAINEHALAAGEFAKAASGTRSAEALRTLQLLEQHHQRLSELLRYPSENPPSTSATESEVQPSAEKPLSTSAAVAELRASKTDIGARSSSPLRNPPSLQHPRRLPPRDLSSSIASNLASARGIRANYTRQPLSPSVSNQQAPGNLESHPRREGKRSKAPGSIPEHSVTQPSWLPPTHASSQKAITLNGKTQESASAGDAVAASDNEGFSRFYSTFESFITKISAPLAFAGLPLVSNEANSAAQPESPSQSGKRISNNRESSVQEPELSKYISRAALRASSRDGYSANDSFYVVPTAGHSVSYAKILSFDQKERRRLASSVHSEHGENLADLEDEDFVDARETPMPTSPGLSRKPISGRQGKLENHIEELEMKNQSLKDIADKLSKRLNAFEMGAQDHSLMMYQSMRMQRPASPGGNLSPGPGDDALKRRISELEEHQALSGKEIERLSRDNEKLKNVVARYRDRWEKLKEGAKTRREGSSGNGNATIKKDSDSTGDRLAAG